jgi:Putative zinc-finger
MTTCHLQAPGTIALYFYGELDASARADVEQHLTTCGECRLALDDLRTIRAALANRPDVSTPPGGGWNGFMARLNEAIRRDQEEAVEPAPVPIWASGSGFTGSYAVYGAMAALVTLVTLSVAYVARSPRAPEESAAVAVDNPVPPRQPVAGLVPVRGWSADAAFASLSEDHFERSKLVVFGLAHKDAQQTDADDWAYERQLASALLSDTRLYRLAAEERGLKSVARVMGDLELVLLQTALSSDQEPATLQQIQSLIRKRDLVTKMNVVAGGF